MSNSLKRERQNSSANADNNSTEYDEWARKLINRPVPQIGIPAIHQIGQVQQLDGLPANEGYDLDSAIGRFAWETIATGKHIPTLFRNAQQFCAIRMLESSILNDLLSMIPQEIYDSAKLTSYFVTNAEAKLLNYINSWHCDGQYGAKNFTAQDLIVSLEEGKKLYQYIRFAFDVLSSGGKNQDNDYSKCGFVRVNNDSLIPYTVLKDGEKSVPLFYFEGQTDILKEKAEPLTGWELSYLKICCKVQGVRKELIAGDSLQIVKLADLKAYFPKRSTFEVDCWPPPKPKSLLPKQNTISSTATQTAPAGYYNHNLANITTTLNNGPKIPNRVAPNDNFQNRSNVVRTPLNSVSANNTVINRTMPSNNPRHPITTTQSTRASVPNNNYYGRTNGNSSTSSSVRPAVPTNTSTSTNSNAHSMNGGRLNNSISNVLTHGLNSSITTPNGMTIHVSSAAPPPPSTRGSSELKRIRVPNPPADFTRVTTILEHADGARIGAYTVKTMIVEGDTPVHCVNSKPFKTDTYLLLLQDLMNKLFPNVSIYPTAVSCLKSLGLSTFLPNSQQILALNNYGFQINRPWEAPLVNATEVVAILPRIKLVLTPKQPINKSAPTRVVNNPQHNNTVVGNNTMRNSNNVGYNVSATNSSNNRSFYNTNSTIGHAR